MNLRYFRYDVELFYIGVMFGGYGEVRFYGFR